MINYFHLKENKKEKSISKIYKQIKSYFKNTQKQLKNKKQET